MRNSCTTVVLIGTAALAAAVAVTPVAAAASNQAAHAAKDARTAETNLALDKPATGSTSCNSNETPAKAVNGSVSGGNSDKWCSVASTRWWQVDLGSAQPLTSFVLEHAGAGGESTSFNTKAFTIQTSTDGSTWNTAVTVNANTASSTTHPVTLTARYVKLTVTTPTQTSDATARIYEFEAYGSGTTQPPSGGCTASNGADVVIRDQATVESPITIAGCTGNAQATATVEVHLRHTYIGDLVVSLIAPDGTAYVLHDRAGGSADNIDRTYPVNLSAEVANGTWKLRVTDTAAQDTGTLDTWTAALGTGGGTTPTGVPIFDKIPQFGIYRETEPTYTPPAGVLMWNRGNEYARKLSDADKAAIGGDVKLRLTYHGQCDDYDRFGSVFYISMPKGQVPTATTTRVTLQDFITPFSDAWQGAKATFQFPDSDMGPYSRALANPDRDVYVGISGGSNPYGGDACDTHGVTDPAYKEVGFRYSLSLVSSTPIGAGDRDVTGILSRHELKSNTYTSPAVGHTAAGNRGTLAITTASYGSSWPNGEEYSNTTVTVKLNGATLTSFSTMIDCAAYEQYSPRGNPGIFRNNTTSNPRSWCPGAWVPVRYYDLGDITGRQLTFDLGIARKVPFTDDSMYRTSLSVLER